MPQPFHLFPRHATARAPGVVPPRPKDRGTPRHSAPCALLLAGLAGCTPDWSGVYTGAMFVGDVSEANVGVEPIVADNGGLTTMTLARAPDTDDGLSQVLLSLSATATPPCALLLIEDGDGFMLEPRQSCSWDGLGSPARYDFFVGRLDPIRDDDPPKGTGKARIHLWLTARFTPGYGHTSSGLIGIRASGVGQ